jgi:hypothetical protein
MDLTIDQVLKDLEELVERTESERFRIMKDGKPVAALVYAGDLEVLEHLDRLEDEMDIAELEQEKLERGDEPSIPIEEVAKKYGIEL